jgi:predicted small lipoprotein YifL
MKRKFESLAVILGLAILLNGCGPIGSFFPLYKADDKVFETGLVGTWKLEKPDPSNPDDKDTRWIFAKSEDANFYDFKWGAVGAKGGFLAKARLVRIGSGLFADFEGDTGNKVFDFDSKDAMIPFPVMSVHMMGRVWLGKDSLEIDFLKDDWVKEQIKAGSFPLAHLGENDDLILTASTDELRKFMQEHAEDKDALSDNYKFIREK